MKYKNADPVQVRKLIREGKLSMPTRGMCDGYVQCNLVVLPKKYALDFMIFAQRNPQPCPILEVCEAGNRKLQYLGGDIDVALDFPRYSVYRNGKLDREFDNVEHLWREDLVSFLIGCSLSFESALVNAGISIGNIGAGSIVSVYNTNIPCKSAGQFHGNMIVSMRPVERQEVAKAVMVTGAMPKVHGAPVHIGDPQMIGIQDLSRTSYGGDVVQLSESQVPVFWACGVTPQEAVLNAGIEFAITHTAGYMLITDLKNSEL